MRVVYALAPLQRLIGMLFGRGAGEDECLVLAPCADIHTYGMRWPIDVAFVDHVGKVLSVAFEVGPCQRRKCPGAYATIERRTYSKTWLKPGDDVRALIEPCFERGGVC